MRLFRLAVGLAAFASEVWALYDNIEKLSMANWEEKVIHDHENIWMVTFYTDWCQFS